MIHDFHLDGLEQAAAPQVRSWHTSWHVLLCVFLSVFTLPLVTLISHAGWNEAFAASEHPHPERNRLAVLLITLSRFRRASPRFCNPWAQMNFSGGFYSELTSVKALSWESVNHTRLLLVLCGWSFKKMTATAASGSEVTNRIQRERGVICTASIIKNQIKRVIFQSGCSWQWWPSEANSPLKHAKCELTRRDGTVSETGPVLSQPFSFHSFALDAEDEGQGRGRNEERQPEREHKWHGATSKQQQWWEGEARGDMMTSCLQPGQGPGFSCHHSRFQRGADNLSILFFLLVDEKNK